MLVIIDQVDKQIMAIKAVRSVTGWGIRKSKDVIDQVIYEHRASVIPAHGDQDVVLGLLHEFNDAMEWRVTNVDEELRHPEAIGQWADGEALLRSLGHMDHTLTVAQVLSVLSAAI